MDQKEYEALLVSIEQMIEASVRGNRRGNHFRILGGLEETARENDRLSIDSEGDGGDRCLDANARGYREGFRETKSGGTS